MKTLYLDRSAISFFEDSKDKEGIRKIELVVSGVILYWASSHYENEYLDQVAEYIQNALSNR